MAGAGCAIQLAYGAALGWGLWPHLGFWSLPVALAGSMVGAWMTVVALGAVFDRGA
jgi:hypothetical protein